MGKHEMLLGATNLAPPCFSQALSPAFVPSTAYGRRGGLEETDSVEAIIHFIRKTSKKGKGLS